VKLRLRQIASGWRYRWKNFTGILRRGRNMAES